MVGLIDGPVALGRSGLAGDNIREVPGGTGAQCAQASSTACLSSRQVHLAYAIHSDVRYHAIADISIQSAMEAE
jgi:hypothetical protein